MEIFSEKKSILDFPNNIEKTKICFSSFAKDNAPTCYPKMIVIVIVIAGNKMFISTFLLLCGLEAVGRPLLYTNLRLHRRRDAKPQ